VSVLKRTGTRQRWPHAGVRKTWIASAHVAGCDELARKREITNAVWYLSQWGRCVPHKKTKINRQ
jgi:hypothetical protein